MHSVQSVITLSELPSYEFALEMLKERDGKRGGDGEVVPCDGKEEGASKDEDSPQVDRFFNRHDQAECDNGSAEKANGASGP